MVRAERPGPVERGRSSTCVRRMRDLAERRESWGRARGRAFRSNGVLRCPPLDHDLRMGPLPYAPTLAPLPKGKKPKTARSTPSEADHQAPGPVRLDHGNVGAVSFEVVGGGEAGDDEDETDESLGHMQRSLRVVTAGRRGNHGE